MRPTIALLFLLIVLMADAQSDYTNASQNLTSVANEKFVVGGYTQIDYNQPLKSGVYQNGKLDIHRMVLLFGYNFSEKTQFVTELEFEHVTEVYVEQAWLSHSINNWLTFKGGLVLIPMGTINEYHEPPSYNGVERPNVDNVIVPTTWREIGAGFTGYIQEAGISYQAYLLNGFNGYDGSGKLTGNNALRSGRQKGANSYMSFPNLSVKADWNTIPGLNIGVAGYFGKTQSILYNGIDKSNTGAVARADSSVVGINMVGIDGRYQLGNFQFKGQYILAGISNTGAYNAFTGNNLGSGLLGWYAEAAYNLYLGNENPKKVTPFVRFEQYDTHHRVNTQTVKNNAYNRTDITTGISLELSRGAVLKADYQWFGNAATDTYKGQLNLGIGIWF